MFQGKTAKELENKSFLKFFEKIMKFRFFNFLCGRTLKAQNRRFEVARTPRGCARFQTSTTQNKAQSVRYPLVKQPSKSVYSWRRNGPNEIAILPDFQFRNLKISSENWAEKGPFRNETPEVRSNRTKSTKISLNNSDFKTANFFDKILVSDSRPFFDIF